MLVLLVWLPNGLAPKGARSLEVHVVWETLGVCAGTIWLHTMGGGGVLREGVALLKLKKKMGSGMQYDRRKKHLTHHEKCQISQAHAQLKWRRSVKRMPSVIPASRAVSVSFVRKCRECRLFYPSWNRSRCFCLWGSLRLAICLWGQFKAMRKSSVMDSQGRGGEDPKPAKQTPCQSFI